MQESYEQFHNCNAYTVTRKYSPYVWTKTLVSYSTPVVKVDYVNGCICKISIGKYAKCSNTTWRQVSRWFDENARVYSDVLAEYAKKWHGYYTWPIALAYNVLTDAYEVERYRLEFEREDFAPCKGYYGQCGMWVEGVSLCQR